MSYRSNIHLCHCKEIWKKITNNNGTEYQLSNKGRLRNQYGKDLGANNQHNYVHTGGFFSPKIHRLVYHYFVQPVKNSPHVIDHINTNRRHNCVCNLTKVSQKVNTNNELTKKHMSQSAIKRCIYNMMCTHDK